jgi:hypothetical protein
MLNARSGAPRPIGGQALHEIQWCSIALLVPCGLAPTPCSTQAGASGCRPERPCPRTYHRPVHLATALLWQALQNRFHGNHLHTTLPCCRRCRIAQGSPATRQSQRVSPGPVRHSFLEAPPPPFRRFERQTPIRPLTEVGVCDPLRLTSVCRTLWPRTRRLDQLAAFRPTQPSASTASPQSRGRPPNSTSHTLSLLLPGENVGQ